MKNKFLLLILFLIPCALFSQATKIAVVIKIIDRTNNSPIQGANIIIKEIGGYYTTNANGIVRVSFPNPGFYSFRILTTEKVEVLQKEILYNDQKINIFIGSKELAEIKVKGEQDKVKLSRYSFTQEEIKRLPGAQGDSLKALQTLPGVIAATPLGLSSSSVNFLQSNRNPNNPPYTNSEKGTLVLRGAGANANQFYFDGFPVSYVYHLGNQSSVLNNNIIKSADIYTGAYSARYGYASGGIININGKDEVKRTQTIVNLNMFLSDAMLETKLSDKVYMIAAVRKSYPNVALSTFYPNAIPPDATYARYDDFQFKIGWEITPAHKISFSTFGSKDIQAYTRASNSLKDIFTNLDTNFENTFGSGSGGSGSRGLRRPGIDANILNRPPVGLNRSFRTDGIRYTYQPYNYFSNTLSISRNVYKEFFDVKFNNPLTAETIFGYNEVSNQSLIYIEDLMNLNIWKDYIKLQVGATLRERSITQRAENISSFSSTFSSFINNLINSDPVFRALVDGDQIKAKETGAFTELNIDYKGFKFVPGVREDFYNLAGQRAVSPRVNTSYTFEKMGTTLLAGAGDHYNAPTEISQFSQKVGNKNLQMEKGEHMAVGISQDIGKEWYIKIEGFRNIYSNLVVQDNNVMNPYALNNLTSDIIDKTSDVMRNPIKPKPLYYSNNGTGYSQGFEVYLKKTKETSLGWFGWISYTHSITKRNNHQTQYTTDEKNQRNALNASRTLLGQAKVGHDYVNYYSDNQLELVYDNDRARLYDYDRTHILNIVFGWKFSSDWQFGSRLRFLTNTPITPITGSTQLTQSTSQGINLFIPNFSSNYNSGRLAPYKQLDIRIDKFFNYDWGILNVYFEIINTFGNRNALSQTFSNQKPYINNENPSTTYDTTNSPYVQSPLPGGRLIYLPLLNFGVEARF